MTITMAHGAGGTQSENLIKNVFLKYFGNNISNSLPDAAVLNVSGKQIAYTTDSFVVRPLFFAGGDIGKLAICGTVNDLLTTGATPKYLSAGFIIEEGFPLCDLEKICASMSETAKEAGVSIVCGDTKVVENSGNANLFINTSGIGLADGRQFSDGGPADGRQSLINIQNIRENDAIIVTNTLGDHHAAIISARENIQTAIKSDVSPLCNIISNIKQKNITGLRDITRGGLATVLCEVLRTADYLQTADNSDISAEIWEQSLPIKPEVSGLCDILGLDPLTMGNEGNMLVFCSNDCKDEVLSLIKNSRYGNNAAIIGRVVKGKYSYIKTKIGTKRVLSPLSGEGLPRIC